MINQVGSKAGTRGQSTEQAQLTAYILMQKSSNPGQFEVCTPTILYTGNQECSNEVLKDLFFKKDS